MNNFPGNLDSDEDFPHKPNLDLPFWSESYAYWAYPRDQNFHLYIHFQRHWKVTDYWNAIIIIIYEDGRVLAQRTLGRALDERLIGPPGHAAEVVEPFKHHRFIFTGGMRDTSAAELWSGPLTDGIFTPVSMELNFTAAAAVWSLNDEAKKQGSWGHAHYEQAMHVEGTMILDGERVAMAGVGYRDHSNGTRDYTSMKSGQMCFATFPSGRFFIVFVSEGNGLTVTKGAVSPARGEVWNDVKVVAAPALEEPVPDQPFNVAFEGPEGQITILCKSRSTVVPFSMFPPSHEVIGKMARDSGEAFVYHEMGIKAFFWDGEEGYGSLMGTWRYSA